MTQSAVARTASGFHSFLIRLYCIVMVVLDCGHQCLPRRLRGAEMQWTAPAAAHTTHQFQQWMHVEEEVV